MNEEIKKEETKNKELQAKIKQSYVQDTLQNLHDKFLKYQEFLIEKQLQSELKVRFNIKNI